MLKEILLVVGGAAIGFTTGWFIRKYKDDAAAVKKELDFNTQYLELREKYYAALKILHTNGLDDELNKEDNKEKIESQEVIDKQYNEAMKAMTTYRGGVIEMPPKDRPTLEDTKCSTEFPKECGGRPYIIDSEKVGEGGFNQVTLCYWKGNKQLVMLDNDKGCEVIANDLISAIGEDNLNMAVAVHEHCNNTGIFNNDYIWVRNPDDYIDYYVTVCDCSYLPSEVEWQSSVKPENAVHQIKEEEWERQDVYIRDGQRIAIPKLHLAYFTESGTVYDEDQGIYYNSAEELKEFIGIKSIYEIGSLNDGDSYFYRNEYHKFDFEFRILYHDQEKYLIDHYDNLADLSNNFLEDSLGVQ
jgi:hypothetical protein